MADLALLLVNLGVELEFEVVVALQGVRVASEPKGLRLELQLELGGLDIRNGNGQVDEVLGRIGLVGALGPKDC